MKQFLHPKYLQLFYHHKKTNEIKSITIQWENVLIFEVENTTQSIRIKDNRLIKMDIIHQLELIAKNVTCDTEQKTNLPLYHILPFEYILYEITIIDKQNQSYTYGINEYYSSYQATRNFDKFIISFK